VEVTGQEARFRAMFAEEAEGRLATLSELLLELERSGGDQELLSSVFREAHTLKGAAAVVGLADVLRVAHAMEEVLEGLRRGDRATPATVDALLGAVDGMREMVPAVLAGDDRADHADRLVADLHDPPPALALPPRPGTAAQPGVRARAAAGPAAASAGTARDGAAAGGTARRAGPAGGRGVRGRAAGRARGHRPARGRAGRHPRAARPEPHP
jgi:two-component system chemotaxis sensor kinase CheA